MRKKCAAGSLGKTSGAVFKNDHALQSQVPAIVSFDPVGNKNNVYYYFNELFIFLLVSLTCRICSLFQRWLKQALEEEGSTSPARRPSLLMPCEGPLSPSINGDSDSPLPYNGTCSLPGSLFPLSERSTFKSHTLTSEIFLPTELPTPLKKRRLSPLDACISESSTPYGSPCATPTRADQLETPETPILMSTPPRLRTEEPSMEPLPSVPTQTINAPQEVNPAVNHIWSHLLKKFSS